MKGKQEGKESCHPDQGRAERVGNGQTRGCAAGELAEKGGGEYSGEEQLDRRASKIRGNDFLREKFGKTEDQHQREVGHEAGPDPAAGQQAAHCLQEDSAGTRGQSDGGAPEGIPCDPDKERDQGLAEAGADYR
ncbi:MAG: hypothetical protein BWY77_01671 [bacterium ADurb.Bin431]|nr:MAG: hypothetical protein BWY77_01671 [bacterium ADurb.Bin431]